MVENKVRHLPVVGDGKRLEGLITRQRLALKADELGSLNVWEITRTLSNLKIKDLMIKAPDVLTITADKTIERAARTMQEHMIGCLPVLEDDIVIGIITETDLLSAFQEMLGLPAEGVRVTVRMPDDEKFINLAAIIVEKGWGVMGIGSFPAYRHPGYWDVVIKIPTRQRRRGRRSAQRTSPAKDRGHTRGRLGRTTRISTRWCFINDWDVDPPMSHRMNSTE